MRLQGKITDEQTGEPLPAAAVYESDQVGKLTGTGTTTRPDGTFDLETKSPFFAVRFLGYETLVLPARQTYYIIELAPKAFDLPPVDIKPKPEPAPALKWLFLLLGMAYLLKQKR